MERSLINRLFHWRWQSRGTLHCVAFFFVIGVMSIAAWVYAAAVDSQRVTFWQQELEQGAALGLSLRPAEKVAQTLSHFSSLLTTHHRDRLLTCEDGSEGGVCGALTKEGEAADLAITQELAREVFLAIPPFAVVWPSERYYYFTAEVSGKKLKGNFRFADIDYGVATFAIEGLDKARILQLKAGKNFEFTRYSSALYKVSFGGAERVFYMPRLPLVGFSDLSSDSLEVLSAMRDDSGLPFALVFDTQSKSFRFLLDRAVEEALALSELLPGLYLDDWSKFAFFRRNTSEHFVLVGVSEAEVRRNSHYDGPFDQVPGDLDLSERALKSYPYLALVGLDREGYLCGTGKTRLAITPYFHYPSLEALRENFARCTRAVFPAVDQGAPIRTRSSALVQCLTHDVKSNYHRQSRAFLEDGRLKLGVPQTCASADRLQ